jgi:hypothetical protein
MRVAMLNGIEAIVRVGVRGRSVVRVRHCKFDGVLNVVASVNFYRECRMRGSFLIRLPLSV